MSRYTQRGGVLRLSLTVFTGVVAALWLLSLFSDSTIATGDTHTCLSCGMLECATGEEAYFDLQFIDRPFSMCYYRFSFPASLGLHWPRFVWTENGTYLKIPLVAIWVPCAILAAALLYRSRQLPPNCCSCGYNLTGNISGRCPECGRPTTISASTETRDHDGRRP